MIDALTPFTFSSSKKQTTWLDPGNLPDTTQSRCNTKKASFAAASPDSSSADLELATNRRETRQLGGLPLANVRPTEQQGSVHGSCFAFPLTMSGSTPTTVQHDGQGLLAGMDSISVNQVIQDAGSWLKQSWDFGEDMRQFSGKSTHSSSQSHPAAVSLI
jgi:hypothetical protein